MRVGITCTAAFTSGDSGVVGMRSRQLFLVCCGLLIIGLIYLRMRQPTVDQQAGSTSASNDHTDGIIGTARCIDCHAEKGTEYLTSGHSNTFRAAHEVPFADRMDGLTFHDPVRDVDFHYTVSSEGIDVRLPTMFGDKPFPLDFAFGSGQHAVTFLSLMPDQDGRTLGVEHRMSWYGHDDSPGLTPTTTQQHPHVDAEFFGRLVRDDQLTACIGCHTTSFEISSNQLHNLRPNVGCENCHGQGAAHVKAVESGDSDLAIGFGESVRRTGDEIKVCAKCHRSPDIVPPDQLFADNAFLVRFQPIGLTQSKCFLESGGSLTCSTCHNPHEHASLRPRSRHIQTCISCHKDQENHSVCPVSATEKCISCHMPAVKVREGMFFHDHWIRVRTPSKKNENTANQKTRN